MRKKRIWQKICGIGAVALFLLAGSTADTAASRAPLINVGLETGKSQHTITANAPFMVTDAAGKRVFLKLRSGEKLTVAAGEKGITVNGKAVSSQSIYIQLDAKAKKGYLDLNGNSYRGNLCVSYRKDKARLIAMNEVTLEEYLYGVVPNEMSPSWPTEALKAQAVAARTFVLHDLKKHASEGYDVCATTHCQVYRGQKSEDARTNGAVTATAGEYLTHNGKAIVSLFHASGGGHTENSENVWGQKEPYLRGVPDYDHHSPSHKWEVKMTLGKLSAVLGNRGKSIGKIRAINLSKLKNPPVYEGDRGISGRVRTMAIEGEKGSLLLSGTEARTLLGLKSTLFDFDKRIFSGSADEPIVIRGFGFGHGLGMSQWGAKAMAEKGGNKNGLYKKILEHYYRETELKKI